MNYYPSSMDHTQADSPEGFVIGRKNVLENPELADATVPMNYLSRERKRRPCLSCMAEATCWCPLTRAADCTKE